MGIITAIYHVHKAIEGYMLERFTTNVNVGH